MYKINVNDKYNFELLTVNDTIRLKDEVLDLDIREFRDGHFHFIYQNKSYNAEVLSQHNEDKSVSVKVNGSIYQVSIEDQFDRLLKEMGMGGTEDKTALEIKAPMPGLVLSVSVTVGQEIKKGDNLLVLEAMKMENMIKSTTAGTVKNITVSKGDKVEKNQVLIMFS